MKRSKEVVLLITGSVLLTGCRQNQPQITDSALTNAVSASNTVSVGGGGPTVVHSSPVFYPWYHPARYFYSRPAGPVSHSGLSSSGVGNNRSGSSASPARGGFGSSGHSSTAG